MSERKQRLLGPVFSLFLLNIYCMYVCMYVTCMYVYYVYFAYT